MKNYTKMVPFIYWDIKTQLEYLQRRIIVYCIAYYELNNTIVSDADYERQVKEYTNILKSAEPQERKNTKYWYCFKTFNSATGFDLFDKLKPKDKEYLTHLTQNILNSMGNKTCLKK